MTLYGMTRYDDIITLLLERDIMHSVRIYFESANQLRPAVKHACMHAWCGYVGGWLDGMQAGTVI